MHIEDYINTIGKQHRNEKQNYEFHSINTLQEFIEGAIKNCSISNVIKSVCTNCRFKKDCRFMSENIEQNCRYFIDDQTVL
jgi:hypothetical protein